MAILAIFASFSIWTALISHVAFPQVPSDVLTTLKSMLDSLSAAQTVNTTAAVSEVIVDDLGEHYTQRVESTHVQATLKPSPSDVPTLAVQQEPVQQKETLRAAATNEIREWDLRYAWTLSVPSLGIKAPVLLPSMTHWSAHDWQSLEEQMQVGLSYGAVAYPHSVNPGQQGTLIVAGHSSPPDSRSRDSDFGRLFAKLPDIAIGEQIVVSGIAYNVESKEVVSPSATSILEQQYDASILKMITCYPVGTTRDRMIVLARKIEE